MSNKQTTINLVPPGRLHKEGFVSKGACMWLLPRQGDGFMDHLVQMNQLYALIVEEREK